MTGMKKTYQEVFEEVYEEVEYLPKQGTVADYIPELGTVSENRFGVYLASLDGEYAALGDAYEKFSIQSISKVFTFAMAFDVFGGDLWMRVGVEPSGDPFNSLAQLEYENGIPRNPLINAGALVIADFLLSHFEHPREAFLRFLRKLGNNPDIDYNPKVFESEKTFGYRNAALVNLMKSFGNITHPVAEVLDFYFFQCAIEMTCQELATSFLPFANHGVIPHSGERILTASRAKRLNALMLTCGFYDEAGQFSFKVGLPGKSGVGGGIAAVHPDYYAVAVWSPRLNKKGNSYLGMNFLERLTTKTGMSIF